MQVCNGKKVVDVQSEIFGTVTLPGESCEHIFDEGDSRGDGTYYVQLNGASSQVSIVVTIPRRPRVPPGFAPLPLARTQPPGFLFVLLF